MTTISATEKPVLIVTGSAPDVGLDMAALAQIAADAPCEYMAIGLDAVDRYPWRIAYMATFHPAEIPRIRERRAAIGGNLDYRIISHEARPEVDLYIADWWKPSGSSALLGVQAALGLGYDRVVLCGCPLTGKNDKNGDYENFRKGWTPRLGELAGRVRSMSGWTAEVLGRPTKEWIHDA